MDEIKVLLSVTGQDSGASQMLRSLGGQAEATGEQMNKGAMRASLAMEQLTQRLSTVDAEIARLNAVKTDGPERLAQIAQRRIELDKQLYTADAEVVRLQEQRASIEKEVAAAQEQFNAVSQRTVTTDTERIAKTKDLAEANLVLQEATQRLRSVEDQLTVAHKNGLDNMKSEEAALKQLTQARYEAAKASVSNVQQSEAYRKEQDELQALQRSLTSYRSAYTRTVSSVGADSDKAALALEKVRQAETLVQEKQAQVTQSAQKYSQTTMAEREALAAVTLADENYQKTLTQVNTAKVEAEKLDQEAASIKKELEGADRALNTQENQRLSLLERLQKATLELNLQTGNFDRETKTMGNDGQTAWQKLTTGAGNATRAYDGFATVGTHVAGLAVRLQGAQIGLAALGTGLTMVGMQSRNWLEGAIQSTAQFEQKLDTIRAIMGTQFKGTMSDIRNLVLGLGRDTMFTADQTTEAVDTLVRAGVSWEDIAGGAARATLDLSSATGSSLKDSVEVATTAINVFGYSGSQMTQVTDTVTKAVNASKIEAKDFADSLRNMGPIAKELNIPFDDVARYVAILGNMGIKGSQAGTALRYFWLNMVPRTTSAFTAMERANLIQINTARSAEVLAQSGVHAKVSTEALFSAWAKGVGVTNDLSKATDAQISKFEKWAVSMGAIQSKFFNKDGTMVGGSQALKTLYDAVKDLPADARLAALSDMFKERGGAKAAAPFVSLFDDIEKKAQETGTTVDDVFASMDQDMARMGGASDITAQRMDTLAGRTKYLAGSWDALKKSLLSTLDAPLKAGVQHVADLVNFVEKIVQNNPALAQAAATMAMVLTAIASLAGPITLMVAAWPYMSAAIAGVGLAIVPVVGILGALATAALAAYYAFSDPHSGLYTALQTTGKVLGEEWPKWAAIGKRIFDEVLSPLAIKLGDAIATVLPWFDMMSQKLTDVLPGAVNAAESVMDTVLFPAFNKIGQVLQQNVFPFIERLFDWLGKEAPIVLQQFGQFWTSTATPALQAFGNFIGNFVIPVVTRLATFLAGNLRQALELYVGWLVISRTYTLALAAAQEVMALRTQASTVMTVLNTAAQRVLALGMFALRAILLPIVALWEIYQGVQEGATIGAAASAVVMGGLSTALGVARIALMALWTAFGPITLAVGAVILVIGLLKMAFDNNFLGIRDAVFALWNNVLQPVFGGLVDFFKNVADGIGGAFAWIAKVFGGGADDAKTAADKMGNSFDNLSEDIASGTADLPGQMDNITTEMDRTQEVTQLGVDMGTGYADDGILQTVDGYMPAFSATADAIPPAMDRTAQMGNIGFQMGKAFSDNLIIQYNAGIAAINKAAAENAKQDTTSGADKGKSFSSVTPYISATSPNYTFPGQQKPVIGPGLNPGEEGLGDAANKAARAAAAQRAAQQARIDAQIRAGNARAKTSQDTKDRATEDAFMHGKLSPTFYKNPDGTLSLFPNSDTSNTDTSNTDTSSTGPDYKSPNGANGGGGSGTSRSPAQQAADVVKNIADAIKAGMEAFQKIAGFAPPSNLKAKVTEFANAAKEVVMAFQDVSLAFDDKLLTHTNNFADTAKKAVDVISSGVDAFNKLRDFVKPTKASFDLFMATVKATMVAFTVMAASFKVEALAQADVFLDTASKAVDIVGKGVDAFQKLRGFRKPTDDSIQSLVDSVRVAVQKLGEASQKLAPELVVRAADLADSAGKVADSLGKTTDFLTKLASARFSIAGLGGRVVELINAVASMVSYIGPIAERLRDAGNAAGPFADDSGKVADGLGKAVGFFDSLTKSNTHPANLRDRVEELINAVAAAVSYMGPMAERLQDAANAAGPFGDNVGKITDPLNKAVALFQSLAATKVTPRNLAQKAEELINAIAALVSYMGPLAAKLQDAATASSTFSDDLGKVVDPLQKSIDLFQSLASMRIEPRLLADKAQELINAAVDIMNRMVNAVPANFNDTTVATYSDSLGKVVDALLKALTLITTLDDKSKFVSEGKVQELAQRLVSIGKQFKDALTKAGADLEDAVPEADTNAAAVATLTGTIVDALSKGYDFLDKLQTEPKYKRPVDQIVADLVANIKTAAEEFKTVAPAIKDALGVDNEVTASRLGTAIDGIIKAFDFFDKLTTFRAPSAYKLTLFIQKTADVIKQIPTLASILSDDALKAAEAFGQKVAPALEVLSKALDIFKAITGEPDDKGKLKGGLIDPDPKAIGALIGKLDLMLQMLRDGLLKDFAPQFLDMAQEFGTKVAPAVDVLTKVLDLFKGITGDEKGKGKFLDVDPLAIGALVGKLYILLHHWNNLIKGGEFQGDFAQRSADFAETVGQVLDTIKQIYDVITSIRSGKDGIKGFLNDLQQLIDGLFTQGDNKVPGTITAVWSGANGILQKMDNSVYGKGGFMATTGLHFLQAITYFVDQIKQGGLNQAWAGILSQMIADTTSAVQQIIQALQGLNGVTITVSVSGGAGGPTTPLGGGNHNGFGSGNGSGGGGGGGGTVKGASYGTNYWNINNVNVNSTTDLRNYDKRLHRRANDPM